MQKNEYFQGTCIDLTHEGNGVVKHNDFTYFVSNMLIGEEGKIKVIKVLKSYGIARLIELTKKSEDRVEPVCKCYKQCGGCHIQHLSTKGQQQFKTKRVKDCIERIGGIKMDVEPCYMMENPWHYRNKVQVPVGYSNGQLVSGFYKQNSNEIIAYDHCHIQNEVSNKIVRDTRILLDKQGERAYSKVGDKGNIRHILTKYSNKYGDIMLVLITRNRKIKNIDEIVKTITSKYPQIKSVMQNINTKNDNVVLGREEIVLYKNNSISDVLLDNKFSISLKSFYQVNPIQVEYLYSRAIELAKLKEEDVVIDAYCGIGTIALSVSKFVKRVYGVEVIPQAIEDAKRNAKKNKVENVEFTCADATEFMLLAAKHKQKMDVVFVDPPRKGCAPEFLEAAVKVNPRAIVYVSCDVATQARDMKILEQYGYVAKYCQPVDMFPHTYHVESIVLLERK